MAVIEVNGLTKKYGDHVAVDGISFSVERGEVFGILGPNGAGKTTMVECLEGLRQRDGGTVSVLGLDPRRDVAKLRPRIGVQLQQSELPERLKVWEALDLYSAFYPEPADWRRLIDEWGLSEKRDTRFGKLSGGQKQRLFIALALIGNPEVAFLDELTTGLDPEGRRDTWDLIEKIRDRGVTVVLVTHFMDEAERLCDKLAVIDKGRLVALNTPAGLVSTLDGDEVVRFRPSVSFEDTLLTSLPEVTELVHRGSLVEVRGRGNLLQAVVAVLARNQITAGELRVDRATLDDAYLALTGRHAHAAVTATAKEVAAE
jgi:ABC-2 type transport system ATP-binding protein